MNVKFALTTKSIIFGENYFMSKLLEEAIDKVKLLPDEEQDNIARLILDEVVWDSLLEKSKDKLSLLANKALSDFKNGNTTELKF